MRSTLRNKHAEIVKDKALALGFEYCGISVARNLDEEKDKLTNWLSRGFHGKMGYLENHFEKRLDPTKLVPGAKSVISLLYNYYPGREPAHHKKQKVARYAYGKDYHFVIKDKLKELWRNIESEIGAFQGRMFVDSAPVMERQWAANSGLGWLGKNSLLINKNAGSYFFIAELIVDLDLAEDGPIKNFCGTCTRCIDACPTGAIIADQVVDASRCISYLTIELKEDIPVAFEQKYDEWVFGCDICQEVCPWNRFAKPHVASEFQKNPGVQLLEEGMEEMSEEAFRKLFKDSPIKRTKYKGLMRNIHFIKKNPADGAG